MEFKKYNNYNMFLINMFLIIEGWEYNYKYIYNYEDDNIEIKTILLSNQIEKNKVKFNSITWNDIKVINKKK